MGAAVDAILGIFETIGIGVVIYGVSYIAALCIFDCDLQLAFYERFGRSVRSLKGKVACVTGASSGIGEHTAYAFAKHAVKLVLIARRKDELERVKRNCLEKSKGQLGEQDILVIPLDITDINSHKAVFNRIIAHFGTLDILVNNAGRSQRALFEHIELPVDRQMFDLNVFSVVNFSRLAVDLFNERGSGQIAVVSSLAGVLGVPFSATYTATKHAIHGYFDALRIEKAGTGIAVTLLCPGPTYTNFLSEAFTDKDGQKYGISASKEDKRMSGERCGELCAISIANRLPESWMALPPVLLLAYAGVYFPILFGIALKVVGPKKLFKLRDSKDIVLNEGKENQ